MIEKLIEKVLPVIIGIMIHKRESLTKKETQAQNAFIKTLTAPLKTKNPVVVALVGLVGSGKTTVAQELAKLLSATIIKQECLLIMLL